MLTVWYFEIWFQQVASAPFMLRSPRPVDPESIAIRSIDAENIKGALSG